ncbi:hypothetical protein E2R51_06050 [Jeotgalibacillus sp. S-D1]|uniref:hypothetical protein n=1 Tax=Jeotgalibacillus sp. S-D1 TaxID=2552189 RepID=UPI00105925A7|nr:hypothetical protein [Jeotgalibacillus sp. S-D1]TDL35277.1 hypothetical protein E2R51_06050 [Jeotgalibacillus sp. S-D1]
MHRRNPFKLPIIMITIVGIIAFVIFLYPTDSERAFDVVEQFYTLEKQGEASASWDLFHAEMKNRFSKDQYIMMRSGLFVEQLQSDSFTFKLSEPKKIKNWQMTSNSTPLTVFKIIVTLNLKSQFGNMDLIQYVYVTQEDKEWRILWDYNS